MSERFLVKTVERHEREYYLDAEDHQDAERLIKARLEQESIVAAQQAESFIGENRMFHDQHDYTVAVKLQSTRPMKVY